MACVSSIEILRIRWVEQGYLCCCAVETMRRLELFHDLGGKRDGLRAIGWLRSEPLDVSSKKLA
jgi:hypothetical protein